jgi:hypothetical protein
LNNNELSVINDNEYKKLQSELKERSRISQFKVAVKVNYELLDLYWSFGKEIV